MMLLLLGVNMYILLTTTGWCLMPGTESSTDGTIPDMTKTDPIMALFPQSLGSGVQGESNNTWMNDTIYPLFGPGNESDQEPELVNPPTANTAGDQGTSDGFGDQRGNNRVGNQLGNNGFGDQGIPNGFGDLLGNNDFGDQGIFNEFVDPLFSNETGDQGTSNGFGTHGALNNTGNQNGTNSTDYYYYYYEEDVERTLLSHSVWVTSVPGVVCNAIIIIVVKELKPFTTNSMFILVLGITDLINVLARIGTALVYFIAEMSDVTCKLFDFLILTTFNYSNAILVLWTVERFIAVWFPIKYLVFCTSRKTMMALLFTALVLCLLSIPYLLDAYAKTDEYGFVFCEYSEFLYETWTPIETAYYIWIPLGVIVTLNVLITQRLVTGDRARLNKGLSSERAEQRARDQRQMTRVLMAVSLAFLVLHLPQACVTMYLSLSGRLEEFLTDPHSPLNSLVWCFVVTELQNSVNFPLYCLTGRDFRAQCCRLVSGCKRDEDDTKQTGATGASSK